jgi:hypothetical protein
MDTKPGSQISHGGGMPDVKLPGEAGELWVMVGLLFFHLLCQNFSITAIRPLFMSAIQTMPDGSTFAVDNGVFRMWSFFLTIITE